MKNQSGLQALLLATIICAGLSVLIAPLHSDTDTRDGWGIVTDQNGTEKKTS